MLNRQFGLYILFLIISGIGITLFNIHSNVFNLFLLIPINFCCFGLIIGSVLLNEQVCKILIN